MIAHVTDPALEATIDAALVTRRGNEGGIEVKCGFRRGHEQTRIVVGSCDVSQIQRERL